MFFYLEGSDTDQNKSLKCPDIGSDPGHQFVYKKVHFQITSNLKEFNCTNIAAIVQQLLSFEKIWEAYCYIKKKKKLRVHSHTNVLFPTVWEGMEEAGKEQGSVSAAWFTEHTACSFYQHKYVLKI